MAQLTEKSIAYLQQRSIIRAGGNGIFLDDGRAIYLDDDEIETLNDMWEDKSDNKPETNFRLSPEQAEEIFFNALCDGMWAFPSYGIELKYSEEEYQACEKKLKQLGNSLPCYEDVFMEMLRSGKEIRLFDTEDAVDDGIWTLERVHELVQKAPQDAFLNMLNEEYDSGDADVILQYVAYEDVIFG